MPSSVPTVSEATGMLCWRPAPRQVRRKRTQEPRTANNTDPVYPSKPTNPVHRHRHYHRHRRHHYHHHQGWALQYASEELRDDDEVVAVALEQEPGAVRCASARLRNANGPSAGKAEELPAAGIRSKGGGSGGKLW